MLPLLFAWFNVVMISLQPVVNWVGNDSIKIVAAGQEELLNRCMESGLEVRYRFDMRFCRRRTGWFDWCGDQRSQIHILQYDPISESFKVTTDRHGDEEKPRQVIYNSLEEANNELTHIPSIPLSFIARDQDYLNQKNSYIGVKIVADCKDSFGSSILDISYILTLGLVKINRFDSGWIAFNLDRKW